jgi:tetratricopeptide (TPR) repeat protein
VTRESIYTGVVYLFILITFLPVDASAQRKKKSTEEAQASGIKLREAEFYFTEGEKFFILEDYAKALLYYQRTLEIAPENATVHYKIAEVLSRSNKQEDLVRAAISIENALRFEKKNKYFYLLAANIYNSQTRFDKAAQAYESMVSEVPGTEEYLFELAAVYQYANKPEDAIRAYNRAEHALGINETSSIQKMKLYLEMGKVKEGFAEGDKLVKAFPSEERYTMGLAEVLSQKGNLPEAIVYLEKFIAENQDATDSKMLLAGFYRDSGQEAKARPLLMDLFDDPAVELGSKLIMLGTYNAELSHKRTLNQADTEKENFVLQLFQKLVRAHPNDASVHIVGGDLYLTTGKNSEAQQEYLKAIEIGDVNFEVWENLLFLEAQAGQWDNVLNHSDQALELFPNLGMIHYFNGMGHLQKRHYREAISALEQSKKLSASNQSVLSEINGALGDAYNATREYEKSEKAYDEALAINPNNNMVLNNYSYFLALRKANLEKAEKMATQLVKNGPDNPAFLDTYAWVLYSRAKFKDAKKVIERAISTGKANATHLEHYGDILFQLGDVDGAVQQWEKARGLNANSETLNKKIVNRKIYE